MLFNLYQRYICKILFSSVMMDEMKPSRYDHHSDSAVKEAQAENNPGEIGVAGPLGFWIAMLLIGALLKVLGSDIGHLTGINTSSLMTVANLILLQPGAIILPLIVAVWIGAKVGSLHRRSPAIRKIALINAVYVAAIYSIAVFIVYLVIYYLNSAILPTPFTLNGFVLNLIIIPDVVVLILLPVMAILSSARHSKK
jgi:hypothetical protein